MLAPNSLEPAIFVDGQADDDLNDRLLRMMVEETEEGIYRCELVFRNWVAGHDEYLYDNRTTLEFGKALQVKVPFRDQAPVIFDGRIMALEGRFPADTSPEIAVLAEDRLQDLRMTRRTRTWTEATDQSIFQEIAGEHSLTLTASLPSSAQHKVVAQVNQSDLAFLRERARRQGAEVWAEGKKLLVKGRTDRDAGQVTLTYGEDLEEFTVLADLAHQRSSVTVTGWDVTAKEAIAVKAEPSLLQGELGGKSGGSAVLAKALAARDEQIVHTMASTEAEAKAIAEAAYRRLGRRFLTGAGQVGGDPRIKVGSSLDLKGLGTLFTGLYYVVEVTHLYTRKTGFVTRFRVERPAIGG